MTHRPTANRVPTMLSPAFTDRLLRAAMTVAALVASTALWWPWPAEAAPPAAPDPQALEDCLRQLPRDTIEAESARDQRLMERWGWGASKRGR